MLAVSLYHRWHLTQPISGYKVVYVYIYHWSKRRYIPRLQRFLLGASLFFMIAGREPYQSHRPLRLRRFLFIPEYYVALLLFLGFFVLLRIPSHVRFIPRFGEYLKRNKERMVGRSALNVETRIRYFLSSLGSS